MKVALEVSRFEDRELSLIQEELGEIVSPWTAGRDVSLGVSKLPAGTRWYAWSREFGKKKGWSVCAESLDELIQEVKDVTGD